MLDQKLIARRCNQADRSPAAKGADYGAEKSQKVPVLVPYSSH
jgi:hypothetical protein